MNIIYEKPIEKLKRINNTLETLSQNQSLYFTFTEEELETVVYVLNKEKIRLENLIDFDKLYKEMRE